MLSWMCWPCCTNHAGPPGLVQLTSAQFMTVYTVKKLSLSLSLSLSLLLSLSPHWPSPTSFSFSYLSWLILLLCYLFSHSGFMPFIWKILHIHTRYYCREWNALLNLIGYILSIPCMHSLWYSHAVSRTTHCVEEKALDDIQCLWCVLQWLYSWEVYTQ